MPTCARPGAAVSLALLVVLLAPVTVAVAQPPAVTGLVVCVAGDRATASWTAAGSGVLAYRLEFASTAPGAPVGWTTTAQTAITGLVSPGTYAVRVAALTVTAQGPYSSPVTFSVGGPSLAVPAAPRDLVATLAGPLVTLRWTGQATDTVTTHRIEVGSTVGASDLGIFDTGTALRTASGRLRAGAYWARVRAGNASGLGLPSADVSFTIAPGPSCLAPPLAPSTPDVLLTSAGGGRTATLDWTLAPASEAPTSYVIELGSASGSNDIATVEVPAVTTVSGPIVPGRFYFLRIRGRNACGLGAASPEASFWVF